jgi:hypothetical protein
MIGSLSRALAPRCNKFVVALTQLNQKDKLA